MIVGRSGDRPDRWQAITRPVFVTLAVGAAVALLPRLALALFAFPSADDYCIAVEARDGFWHMQAHWYMTWTGRYAAVFLEAAVAQFDLLGTYRWFALATLVSTLLAARALIGALCPRDVPSGHVTLFAFVATAVFVGGLPSSVEACYWLPGAASYQWGLIAYVVWLSQLIRIGRSETVPGASVWRLSLVVVLTVFLPGFNEVMAPITLATVLGFIAINRSRTLETSASC